MLPTRVSSPSTATGSDAQADVLSTAVPTQSGYSGDEQFRSGHGTIAYRTVARQAALSLRLHGLQAGRHYVLGWRNDPTRGYEIGVFTASGAGAVAGGSARLFRPGEARGASMFVGYLDGETLTIAFDLEACLKGYVP